MMKLFYAFSVQFKFESFFFISSPLELFHDAYFLNKSILNISNSLLVFFNNKISKSEISCHILVHQTFTTKQKFCRDHFILSEKFPR